MQGGWFLIYKLAHRAACAAMGSALRGPQHGSWAQLRCAVAYGTAIMLCKLIAKAWEA